MQRHQGADDRLAPIEEVAARFGLRTSALRYYERIGLLEPTARRAGKRWYDGAAVRRLAMITFWQRSGLMSLDEIATVLEGAAAATAWKEVVHQRMTLLHLQIERMTAAREYLRHLATCPREHALDGCPYFEDVIWKAPNPSVTAKSSGAPAAWS